MKKSLILFGYIYTSINVFDTIEARVFCQDSNARPWIPHGFTCPVVCASVLDAIDKLIMIDYKRSIKEQLGESQKRNKRLGNEDYNNEDIPIDHYRHLRSKSSVGDDNDKGITNFNNNLEKSKDDTQKVGRQHFNTDIENKLEYHDKNERQESENFHEDEEIYKDNPDIVLHNSKREENTNINAKTETTNENINKAENNRHNKEISTNFDDNIKYSEKNNDKTTKLQTDYNQINTNDLKILENIKHVKGILRRSGNVEINTTKYDVTNNIDKENEKCWFLENFTPQLLIGKVVRRKCGRRSNFDAKFVRVMTNVLNKYVDTVFRFTDEMTEILLENIFDKNTDLRNNIFDVNKLLSYLRESVTRHRIHSHRHVITLQSTHCLTLSMPGCFCKSGFVESSGQCVKPEDCISDENYLQYLTRIVIL